MERKDQDQDDEENKYMKKTNITQFDHTEL